MSVIKSEIRSGAYYDSAVLMKLQRSLSELPGILDSGVVMGTDANKELLAHIDLVSPEVDAAQPDDLVLVVRAENDDAAKDALAEVDGLLTARKSDIDQEYQPRSIEGAAEILPDSSWVLVSVAGRYAAGVARQALKLGKHVFLFSDNVSLEDEIDLKKSAGEKGLLVMGADCGTANIRDMGLGFANKTPLGPVGVVAAAGTGLQQVTSRIAQMGSGITFGIGTGGRDLKEEVGGATFLQGLELLSRDPDTKVILLVSKPPSPVVAERVLRVARTAGKPVVVCFIGRAPIVAKAGNLYYAMGLDDAARQAVELANSGATADADAIDLERFATGQRYLRGLYSGGTLAYEAQYILKAYLTQIWANAPLNKADTLANSLKSEEHTIVDLGEDEFTVGRLHPMMDNELRIRRLHEEADDPEVAVIMLDVVIGYGSHPDPASEIAPAIAEARARVEKAGRYVEFAAVVTGTEDDPQVLENQIKQMNDAGAWVSTSNEEVVRHAGEILQALNSQKEDLAFKPVDLDVLHKPLEAINVGLESFAEDLQKQGAQVVQVNWRPPAGGNEKLMGILARLTK
jgi:FdrA protein